MKTSGSMKLLALCVLLLPASLGAAEPPTPAVPEQGTLKQRLYIPGTRVGFVDVVGQVGPDGRVIEATVVRSDPPGKFDKDALRIVRDYRFRPKLVDGVAVARKFEQRVVFGNNAEPVNAPPEFAQEVVPADAERELVPIERVPPRFPQRALSAGVSGWVRLTGVVGVDGKVKSAEVASSRPTGMFDAESLHAIRQWRFTPYLLNGQPTERPFTQTFNFNLQIPGRKADDPLADLIAKSPADAERLFQDLRARCPDRAPRADDAPNEALRAALALPKPPDRLSELADWSKTMIEQIEPCLFSSWEQLRDPSAYELAARFAELGAPAKVARESAAALRAYGAALAAPERTDLISADQRLQVRAWMFLRIVGAYQRLVDAQAKFLGTPVASDPQAVELLDKANVGLRERGLRDARSVLVKGMKRIPDTSARLLPLMMLAKVEASLEDTDAALVALDQVVAIPNSPWNAYLASHIARASLCGRMRKAGCFDESFAVVNRELGTEDRLAF